MNLLDFFAEPEPLHKTTLAPVTDLAESFIRAQAHGIEPLEEVCHEQAR